jgi:hypothetical protein
MPWLVEGMVKLYPRGAQAHGNPRCGDLSHHFARVFDGIYDDLTVHLQGGIATVSGVFP